MASFISTNAVALVATLAGLLVACVVLLFASFLRRARQRNAVRRLLELARTEGRFGCDAVTSRFVHDLNNLILVMSLESERDDGSGKTDVLQPLIDEGRGMVERCRAQLAAVESATSDLCAELRIAAGLLRDAGYSDVDVAIARAVPASVMVPRPATDIHVLVLSIVCAAQAAGGADRLSLTVARGRDAALPEDDNDGGWVNISAVAAGQLAEDDAASVALSRMAKRLSGEVVLPDASVGRHRLAVSLPFNED